MNRLPKVNRIRSSGCGKAFSKQIEKLGLLPSGGECDIVVIGERGVNSLTCDADVVFCPTGRLPDGLNCVEAVSVGMDSKASVCFSSVGDETSYLCVNREIDFFGKNVIPGEYRVAMKRGFSLYENMVFGFLDIFL